MLETGSAQGSDKLAQGNLLAAVLLWLHNEAAASERSDSREDGL